MKTISRLPVVDQLLIPRKDLVTTFKPTRSDVMAVLRRLGGLVAALLVIIYLTLFGLTMMERGNAGLGEDPAVAAVEAGRRTLAYFTDHPQSYTWQKAEISALHLVALALGRSAGLLVAALAAAVAAGVPLGIAIALGRRRRAAPFVLLLSVLGISTPSFLLAMLFWVVDIYAYRELGMPPLPPTGFGWDAHLVMPALVLAARPFAQIVQITYVSLSDILGQDYIRTANAKGLHRRTVLWRHALRNVPVPILTTLGTSLRLSLASLPVVETFFLWPGVGAMLLVALDLRMTTLITDLIVALGLLFLLVNLLLEGVFPLLDPRLRGGQPGTTALESVSLRSSFVDLLQGWWGDLTHMFGRHGKEELPPLGAAVRVRDQESGKRSFAQQFRWLSRGVIGNPALVIGTLLVLAFFGLALFGDRLTSANPYETHGTMTIEGEIGTPPFKPSSVFPWGTDPVGRDIQALVFAGAKRTLALALFATLARMLAGAVLGALAGWWQGSRFDKLVTGAISVWAAFPVTLFAMIFILALGIKQGMSVFIVALCLVGWGEIAQFVRGQVIGIKPQLHIEAARSVGTRPDQILTQHVLPGLVPSLLVLSALEMGAVLMLLAELGFLNIFLGGGFQVQIAEVGRQVPLIYFFSDAPEWGALLANIRVWWRSYPWLAWYPGLFFFLAILAFNLFGEGLRRFLDQTGVNIGKLFNRYALLGMGVVVFSLMWVLRSNAPLGIYKSQALQFNPSHAMADIEALTSVEFAGRRTGTPETKLAAEFIAARMQEIGLDPAGTEGSYLQEWGCPRPDLADVPRLEILDSEGNVVEALTYREDFVEFIGYQFAYGEAEGSVIGLIMGPNPDPEAADPYGLGALDLWDKVVIVPEDKVSAVFTKRPAGVLVVADDPERLERKYLYPVEQFRRSRNRHVPVIMYISEETADQLLAPTGTTFADLEAAAAQLDPGQAGVTGTGAYVRQVTPIAEDDLGEKCYNVIGYLAGTGSVEGLDANAIIVSAYYDGLGIGPDGTFYQSANDNASGVATMLEIARAMHDGSYAPKKTVVFVAWAGGERNESLSLLNVMSARVGFSNLMPEAIIELSGVGAGEGNAIAVGEGSSFRLTQLLQDAGSRLDVATTTRGRGPHFGLGARQGFGGRTAMTLDLSWDGSDRTAHTATDTLEAIDPEKLQKVGRTTLLVVTTLSRETNY